MWLLGAHLFTRKNTGKILYYLHVEDSGTIVSFHKWRKWWYFEIFRYFVLIMAGPLNYLWWTTNLKASTKSLFVHGAKVFNILPKHLQNCMNCSMLEFKTSWMIFYPKSQRNCCWSGYNQNHSAASNSLIMLVPIFIGISDFTLKLVAFSNKLVFLHLKHLKK